MNKEIEKWKTVFVNAWNLSGVLKNKLTLSVKPEGRNPLKAEQWWGVFDCIKEKLVYVYKDQESANGQAHRTEWHIVIPLIVLEQTPSNQSLYSLK